MQDMKKNNNNMEIELATNSHAREELFFIKYFNVFPQYMYKIIDMETSSIPDIKKIIKEYIPDIEKISHSEWISTNDFGDFDDDFDDGIDFDSDVLENNVDLEEMYISRSKSMIININESLSFYSKSEISEDFLNSVKNTIKNDFEEKNKSSVYILSHTNNRGMYLTSFKISDDYKELNLKDNYNDGFEKVHSNILENLSSNKIGLYLLHGKHGTGKTTYIRHLIRNTDKRVIFVSPSMIDQFSSPEMIPFLMRYPDSIIIIEDAENIIKARQSGGNQSVSNLLNLSDGVLGDCLKFQIICTFNTNKKEIDSALLRKGRLIQSWEFNELSLEKTNNLIKKLGSDNISDEPMKLSDIYNQFTDNNFEDNTSKIGF